MVQVGEVEGQLVVVSREKESIEALACDLILERDEAMAEVEELKRVHTPTLLHTSGMKLFEIFFCRFYYHYYYNHQHY